MPMMSSGENLIPVILVLGVSNTGKSTLINWMLDSAANSQRRSPSKHVAIKETLQSMTSVVEEVPFSYQSSSGAIHEAVLVDTPGLDHSSLNNSEIVQIIAEWFNRRCRAEVGPPLRVSDILYCHDISSDFVNPTMRLDLEVLSKLCGPKAMNRVTFLTLKWDQLNRQVLGEAREAEIERGFWSRLTHGTPCSVKRAMHQDDASVLLADIFERMEERTELPLLQMQKELEEAGGDWSNTQVGRCLDPARKQTSSDGALSSLAATWRKALHGLIGREPPVTSRADSKEKQVSIDPVLKEGKKGDIVILVMGEVHSGKSTFLKAFTGSEDIGVGTKLTPCTKGVRGFIGMDGDRAMAGGRLIFVDTPGLDGSTSVLHLIADWLQESYKRKMDVGGVLFLHDISRPELSRSSKQNLKIFSKLCGDGAMKQVALVTTKWDRISIEEGRHRVEELNTVWEGMGMLRNGASVYHLPVADSDSKEVSAAYHRSPADIIQEILSKAGNVYPTLQIQKEMVREGRPLWETGAGREVPNLLEQEKHMRQRRIFRSSPCRRLSLDTQATQEVQASSSSGERPCSRAVADTS